MTIATLIRPATPDDLEDIFAIRTAVKENHLSREQMAEMGITPDVILTLLTAETCIWIAQRERRAVGFSMVDFDDGCLFALFVHPQYEGLGIGSRLIQTAEAALFEHHATLWLETDSQSRAAAFYQRHGWQAVQPLSGNDMRYQKNRV